MTDVARELTHTSTGERRMCIVIEDYFGKGKYGYRFHDERVVYTRAELELLQPKVQKPAPTYPYPDP